MSPSPWGGVRGGVSFSSQTQKAHEKTRHLAMAGFVRFQLTLAGKGLLRGGWRNVELNFDAAVRLQARDQLLL